MQPMSSIASSPSSLTTPSQSDYDAVELLSPSVSISSPGRYPKQQQIPRHSRFFFDDGNVTFIVNDLTYRVHRSVLCPHSTKFDALMDLQTSMAHNAHETYLKDVTTREFDAFLSLFYPSDFMVEDNKTLEDWSAVLRLADKWEFPSIRQLAVKRVGTIAGPVDKLAFGHEYDVDEWLVPSYTALSQRKEPLTLDEGRRLGMEDVVLVARMRESIRPATKMPVESTVRERVERVLDLPLPESPSRCSSRPASPASQRKMPSRPASPASQRAMPSRPPGPPFPSTDGWGFMIQPEPSEPVPEPAPEPALAQHQSSFWGATGKKTKKR